MGEQRDVFDNNIASMTQFYERTGNVAAAWAAFSFAFTHGRPIPDSIYREVERFAAGVALIAQQAITEGFDKTVAKPDAKKTRTDAKKSRQKDGAITLTPEELGKLWRGKDKRDPVGRLQKEWRDYQLYWLMRNRVVGEGLTVDEAAEQVSAMRGALTKRSLQNLWKLLNSDG